MSELAIRHIEFNIPVAQFDDSETIRFYAERFVDDDHQHESIVEAAERVSGLLMDKSAGSRFKAAVRKLKAKR